jgi:DNA polymerase (family X)
VTHQPLNCEVADRLAELAALSRARRTDRFRVRAYDRAARLIRSLPVDLATLDQSEVRHLEGIGEAITRLVAEYARTGRIALLDELREGEPPGFGALLGLPLMGVRDARLLAGDHGFADVESLRAAAGTPGGLSDLDERLAGRIRESLRRLDSTSEQRIPLTVARREAAAVSVSLAALPGVREVLVAGGVRRGAETVDGLDLVLLADRLDQVLDALPASRAVVRGLARDDARLTVLSAAGRQAELWFAEPPAAGSALLWSTGSPAHLSLLCARAGTMGLDLRPDGVWRAGRRVAGGAEPEVYRTLGLPFIPPELREGKGEIQAAADHGLPRLVELADLRGDLHVHSDWSRDGKDSLDRLATAAAARGYAYMAVTDHAENLAINGMSRDTVRARRLALGEVQERHPQVRLLDAVELNIGLDGSLDYDLEFLLDFDVGVASVHSHMDQPADRQTDRILAAIAHPAVHVIGHPTGRIIGHRPGYGIELTSIAQAAAETGTALEVNGSPRRLDLAAEMVRAALHAGATIALSSDAHSVGELDSIDNAVTTARRGWATPDDVLNRGDLESLLDTVGRKKSERRSG